MECGKTLDEARGEIRRAIENVEVACGIPTMMQGLSSEDIAPGIFTGSGQTARLFRHGADAGNVGVNIGVVAPMAFLPFSGWKESFFGDLHGQAHDAVDFFTQKKVVIERWPKAWSRTF